MNDFGVDLTGKHGIFKKKQFYLPNAQKPTRTFVCESGPGCEPNRVVHGQRKITGHWLTDGMRDTISSYDLESYIDASGKEILRPDVESDPVEMADIRPTLLVHAAPVKPPAAPPQNATRVTVPATVPADISVSEVLDKAAAPKAEPARAAADAPKPPDATPAAPRSRKAYDVALAVKMYQEGKTVAEIALAQGFTPGNGLNKTRTALREAGVYKK